MEREQFAVLRNRLIWLDIPAKLVQQLPIPLLAALSAGFGVNYTEFTEQMRALLCNAVADFEQGKICREYLDRREPMVRIANG